MKIYVCIKHVPDTAANIKVVKETSFDETVKFVLNPYDEFAVEEAVQTVKKFGGEVVIVTIGKAAAANTLRSALAVGADRGILVNTDGKALDSIQTARTLKAAIIKDGQPDLIFMGKQSIDVEGMQTGYHLAAALDMPFVSNVTELSLEGSKVTAARELGGGAKEILEMESPCIIAATKGLNEPRYPKLPDIMKAKKKKVDEVALDSLADVPQEAVVKLVKLEPVPDRGQAKILNGDVASSVKELLRLLKEEAKVL